MTLEAGTAYFIATLWNDLGTLLVSITQMARKFKTWIKMPFGTIFLQCAILTSLSTDVFPFLDNEIACGCE